MDVGVDVGTDELVSFAFDIATDALALYLINTDDFEGFLMSRILFAEWSC